MLVVGGAIGAYVGAADPSKVGDLTGNLPWGVYLLIPLAIVLAVVTALALGSGAEPGTEHRRRGGVTRALRSDADGHHVPD